MFVVGIDAGGTKTVCQVADENGAITREVRGPGANLISLGEGGVEEVLKGVVEQALDDRVAWPDAVCLGMAGADQPREAERVRRVLVRLGARGQTVVVNDALIALEAGAPDSPGVVLTAGTGSIAYGRDPRGRAARAGGWGYLLADEGSAFWIGREAIAAVLWAADGRGPATALADPVLAHYGVARPRDIAREVYEGRVTPSTIAGLTADVERVSQTGDLIAIGILDRAAVELARLASAVIERLDLVAGPIVLSGGVFHIVPSLTAAVSADLATRWPRATARLLDVEPASGAVRLAIALAHGRLQVPEYIT